MPVPVDSNSGLLSLLPFAYLNHTSLFHLIQHNKNYSTVLSFHSCGTVQSITMSGAIIILINFCLVWLAIASSPAVIDSQSQRVLSPYQLQTNLNPIHYDLMLDTGDFTTPSEFFPMPFNGEVAILFEVLQTTTVVELHCRDIDIEWESVRIESAVNANPMLTISHQHSEAYEKCIFEFPEQLLANERYQIIIRYDGQIRRDFKGLYRSSYNINTSRR